MAEAKGVGFDPAEVAAWLEEDSTYESDYSDAADDGREEIDAEPQSDEAEEVDDDEAEEVDDDEDDDEADEAEEVDEEDDEVEEDVEEDVEEVEDDEEAEEDEEAVEADAIDADDDEDIDDDVDDDEDDVDEDDEDVDDEDEVDDEDVDDKDVDDEDDDIDHKHDDGPDIDHKHDDAPSENALRLLVIGDTHFKHRQIREGEEFAQACVAAARRLAPDAIVCLGDTLDTHEIVHVQAHRLACDFLRQLAEIAHVYLLIGNHDLINHKQFLTRNHVFTPLALWPNLTVVDTPRVAQLQDYTFVMCPFVPNGRFVAALDTLLSPASAFHWQVDADCIFAHQEFRGCSLSPSETSTEGDRWAPEYPPVISGHIHEAHDLGDNIFYTGSVIQHSFGETKPKKLWLVTFDRDEYGGPREGYDPFRREFIELGLKRKQVYEMRVSEVADTFRPEWLETAHVKLKLSGSAEQIQAFRLSPHYASLVKEGVKVAFVPDRDAAADLPEFAASETCTPAARYHAILDKLIARAPDPLRTQIHTVYAELAAEDKQIEEASPTTLVFQNA